MRNSKNYNRVVIIDDFPGAIANMKKDIASHLPDLEVVGVADGVVAGGKLLRNTATDIIFLDIQMNDGTGFDLLDLVEDISFSVIFTTASHEHALKAFEYSAIDYLLKPIDPNRLVEAVEKARKYKNISDEQLKVFRDAMTKEKDEIKNVILHTNDKVSIVAIKDIIRCTADGNYTKFYLNTNESILVTKTLKAYDQLLSKHRFMRVHQSHLINPDFLKAFVKSEGGYLLMKDGSQVPVSVRKRSEIMKIIEGM